MQTAQPSWTPFTCGLSGISPKGNFFVQSRRGGGFMLLRRGAQKPVVETTYYTDACAALDIAVGCWVGDTAEGEEVSS